MEQIGILVAVVSIVGYVLWAILFHKSFDQRIEEINQESGCNFSSKLYLGTSAVGFLFDNTNKKICLWGGRKPEIFDYSYIRSWELHWFSRPGPEFAKYSNIYFSFLTTDLARPIIKIPQLSKARADEWNARLEILFA
ncbi:MAG TPA: hypothetical protein VF450_03435 [Noviherbaspirillum sp.]